MLRTLTRAAAAAAVSAPVVARAMATSTTGIHKMDLYFPSTYVNQTALEKFDGVSAGKYTKGLGLRNMAFCDDREDISSVCLTAVHNFMERTGVSWKDIGRLEVGTETLIDKSKAVKTVLMQLAEKEGITDLEGVDNINACYGGTAALLNTAAWADSAAADGRYGLVVTGDIATYEPGPARPTGGAAVAVMLVGKHAPLRLESTRHSYFEHAYDFYKPNMASEWPVVDGHHSVECYLRALDSCYNGYISKFERANGRSFSLESDVAFTLFHTPFVKMTQKAFARLMFNEARRHPERFDNELRQLAKTDLAQSYGSREVEKAFTTAGAALYEKLCAPTVNVGAELGNSYTASLYASLVGTMMDNECANKRLLMFSYGSGLASTMFSLHASGKIASVADTKAIAKRLAARVAVPPEEFSQALARRQETDHSWTPKGSVEHLASGTYYLTSIDSKWRRHYARKA